MFRVPSFDKYKFYVATTVTGEPYKVVAVSSYAGRPVRGVAKCANDDKFDLETGKKLAAARCNQKIATKRYRRAVARLNEANDSVTKAQKHLADMKDYWSDAYDSVIQAQQELDNVLGVM